MPIKTYAQSRGLTSLFHFTRVENLPSILQHGLLPKPICASRGIQPVVNDAYRHDGTGAICATISFPNYRMFYRLRCDHPAVDWAVLELDSSLLWRTDCAFSSTNAGDGSVYDIPISERKGLSSLRSMFEDFGDKERSTLQIPANFTTNPQAEVLLLDGATASDINRVLFRLDGTCKSFSTRYPELECLLNGGYFDSRSDYAHWKNR